VVDIVLLPWLSRPAVLGATIIVPNHCAESLNPPIALNRGNAASIQPHPAALRKFHGIVFEGF
jgi:hypothetical protein